MDKEPFLFHCFAYIAAVLDKPTWNCMNPTIFSSRELTSKIQMAKNIVKYQRELADSSYWNYQLHQTATSIINNQYESLDLIQFALGVNRIAIMPPTKNPQTDIKCYGYNVEIVNFFDAFHKLIKQYPATEVSKLVNAIFVSGNNIVTLTDKDTSASIASIILMEEK